jgi:hypothetical protein
MDFISNLVVENMTKNATLLQESWTEETTCNF